MPDDPTRQTSELQGQVALVTGASSGIGAAVAERLARAGASVVVNYRQDDAGAQEVVRRIAEAGGRATAVQADVADEAQVLAMFSRTMDTYGRLDILVANAGIQQDAPATAMTLEQWRRVIDVNLTGQFLCAREAIKCFLQQSTGDWATRRSQPPGPQQVGERTRVEGGSERIDRGQGTQRSRALGKIICMSSVHELIPWAGHVNYAASKGGLMLMMKTLAQEVAHHRIRVNGIAPGAIRTDINQDAWGDPASLKRLLQLIPYGRVGEPADVAEVALWLASDASDYVTGTTIFVDGGMSLYPAFRDNG